MYLPSDVCVPPATFHRDPIYSTRPIKGECGEKVRQSFHVFVDSKKAFDMGDKRGDQTDIREFRRG